MAKLAGVGIAGSSHTRIGDRLRAIDMTMVRVATRSASPALTKRLAVSLTWLGNGWIYPILSVVICVRWGLAGFRIIAAAMATAALLHSVYPKLKRRFLRDRPFVADTSLKTPAAPLDSYSFPSGHTMTLTGVFVPLAMFWPAALPVSIVMLCGLAWSRLAMAHHYPSDVLAGAAMGLAVGYPVATCLGWLW